MMRDPFLMMYADDEEWYWITFSPAPLLASREHLHIRNKSQLPDMTLPFPRLPGSEQARAAQHTHIHTRTHTLTQTHTRLFIGDSLIINLFLFSIQGAKKRERIKNGLFISHAGSRDDTQIRDSTETKWNDLDISLRRWIIQSSGVPDRQTDRWEEQGKTKIDVYSGGGLMLFI